MNYINNLLKFNKNFANFGGILATGIYANYKYKKIKSIQQPEYNHLTHESDDMHVYINEYTSTAILIEGCLSYALGYGCGFALFRMCLIVLKIK